MTALSTTIKSILVFAIVSILIACMSRRNDGTTVEESKFAFAVTCGEPESQELCLEGQFKAGINVTLLQSDSLKTCSTKTIRITEQSESSGSYLTRLEGSCGIPKEFDIAVLNKSVTDYEHIFPKEIVSPDIVSRIDKSIKDNNALLSLRKKAQDLIPGEIKELEGVAPSIYQFFLPDARVMIASYKLSTDMTGPQVVLINDRVYPLSGWCSYETLNVFRYNSQYYIQTGSYCCGCGITIMELYRITPNSLVEVLSDGGLSD
jgi:hypothetical protein